MIASSSGEIYIIEYSIFELSSNFKICPQNDETATNQH